MNRAAIVGAGEWGEPAIAERVVLDCLDLVHADHLGQHLKLSTQFLDGR
jgi:hypothetical protein